MPDGGRLTLRTTNVGEAESRSLAYKGVLAGEYVLIRVPDTSTGIAEEIRDRIFEPFFSTKEVKIAARLRTSTVYGIINQTGGFVFV